MTCANPYCATRTLTRPYVADGTHNPLAVGSSPTRPTIRIMPLTSHYAPGE
jgi:hypothetical protein